MLQLCATSRFVPKLAPRLAELGTSAGELIEALLCRLVMVEPATVDAVIAADPDDDHVLACAVAGRARSIVSGDGHLLALQRYEGIVIRTPSPGAAHARPPPARRGPG